MSRVIAGDIGGTKTRLAIASVIGAGVTASHLIPQTAGCTSSELEVRIERECEYRSRDFAAFEDLLAEFLIGVEMPACAAFGIAGPVQGRAVRTTNLPWFIEADALQQRFGLATCILLNDLEATAYGISALKVEDFLILQSGRLEAQGNAAIIAAGTGLGEAGLYWDGRQHHPYATEGGHTSFSPQSELETELLRYLQQRYGHVSWERVVSGMGLRDLYEFLRAYRDSSVPQWLRTEMDEGDAAAAISRAALAERDDICIETLHLFVQLYGAEAGNLALKTMSHGGLYVGGGIAPKILPLLQTGHFMEAFLSKGRMRPLLEAMPVHVILNDHVPLLGSALCVARLA